MVDQVFESDRDAGQRTRVFTIVHTTVDLAGSGQSSFVVEARERVDLGLPTMGFLQRLGDSLDCGTLGHHPGT